MKAGILPEFAARWELWELIVLVISDALVIGFVGSGTAQRFDLACSALTDRHILDCGPFLLAAVVLIPNACCLLAAG